MAVLPVPYCANPLTPSPGNLLPSPPDTLSGQRDMGQGMVSLTRKPSWSV